MRIDAVQRDTPTPLEQSWNYGEAVNAASFNKVRRGIVEIDGAPVATLQTAERRLPFGINMVRLTRGPVTAQADLLPDIAQAVRREYPRWSRHLLFWMPDTVHATEPMRSIGKRPMTTGYTTAWLDLAPEETQLRRNLRGNWRNALNRAQDDDTVTRVSWRMQDVEPFIAQYVRDRKARKYSGPSANFVHILAENFGRDVVLVRALDHGDAIAASLFLRHGTSATYYLS
ncbi:MAG: GNAT family N-acetyltransferase [Alphaproteobacteria bacterium]